MAKEVNNPSLDRDALATAGIPYETLNAKTLAQLESIETAIRKGVSQRDEAIASLADNVFSVRRIAHEAGLSRTTIYNKQVLMDYLNARTNAASANLDAERIRFLEERIKELEGIICALHKRDGEAELLKKANNELEREADNLKRYIDRNPHIGSPDLSVRGFYRC